MTFRPLLYAQGDSCLDWCPISVVPSARLSVRRRSERGNWRARDPPRTFGASPLALCHGSAAITPVIELTPMPLQVPAASADQVAKRVGAAQP